MSIEADGLTVDEFTYRDLDERAKSAGRSYEDYVNDCAALGLGLAEFAVNAAPEPVYIGFEIANGNHVVYPLTFDDDSQTSSTGTLAQPGLAAELRLVAATYPVPLAKELLEQLTSTAHKLKVDRAKFLGISVFLHDACQDTIQAGNKVLLRDADDNVHVLSD
ncbi:hypothetical protein BH09PAT3_BH09PAT3_3010 [soil metagenome]